MSLHKQIRFPELPTTEGGFRLIINRESEPDFVQAAADTITLSDSLRIFESVSDVSQEEADDEGFPVADAIEITLMDRRDYLGTCDGSPVVETVGSFIHERLFTDEEEKYYAWVIFTGLAGEEKIFRGTIDPNDLPGRHRGIHKPYTTDEEIVGQSIRLQLISAAEDLKTGRMGNVKAAITTSDCINKDCYLGLTAGSLAAFPIDSVNPFTSGNERSLDVSGKNWMHASLFWQDSPKMIIHGTSPGIVFWNWGGVSSAAKYWNKVHTASPTPDISKGGAWWIKISKLIELIAAECGMEFNPADLLSALDFYRQKVNNTNKDWEIHTTPYAATDLYISYNAWFGVHVLDGSNWNNPLRFQDDETCLNALSRTADFLISDLRFEVNQTTAKLAIKFIPKGSSTGSTPAKWGLQDLVIDSRGDARTSVCDYVTVHNKHDDTKIKCPAGAQGDSKEYIIPYRTRQVGRNSADPRDPWFTSVFGFSVPDIYFDNKLPVEEQWKCFCVGNYRYTGNQANAADGPYPLNDYWRSLCYAFVYDASTTNDMVPSNWTSIDDGSDFSGMKIVSMVLPAGESIPSEPIGQEYYNSRNTHAQYFAKDKVGLRATVVRSNVGITADDGSFSGIKTGLTVTFKYRGINRTFRLSGIRRKIVGKELSNEAVLTENITFPTITEQVVEEEASDTTTSSSSTATTSSVTINQGSNVKALIVDPNSNIANKTKPLAGVDVSIAFGNDEDDDVTGIEFYDAGENESVKLKAPDTLDESYELRLPEADGSPGQSLQTDGAGNLIFGDSADTAPFGVGYYGTVGFDGTSTVAGLVPVANVYTLARDIYCIDMTVDTGVTIITNSFRIFGSGSLLNEGIIQTDGTDSAGVGGGIETNMTGSIGYGAGGGNGGTGNANGTNGGNSANGVESAAGSGSGGGAGIQLGGSPGTNQTPSANYGGIFAFAHYMTRMSGLLFGSSGVVKVGGGAGGGGGASNVGGTGGGGGGGGGVMVLFFYSIDNQGVISAIGGDGGNAVGTNAGGGGGGQGGTVFLGYHTYTGTAADVSGGQGGNAVGIGIPGQDGASGRVIPFVS